MNSSSCVACGSRDHTPLPPDPDLLPGEGDYQWHLCASCGSHFATPRLALNYDSAYLKTKPYRKFLNALIDQTEEVTSCRNGERLNQSIAYTLLRNWNSPGSLLDVGAGSGYLMKLGHQLGYSVSGVEVSKASREFISANIPEASLKASLDEISGSYTHITGIEVLEHLEEPLEFAVGIRKLLEPKGIFVMSVPNVERPYWRYERKGSERKVWIQNGVGDTAPHHLTRFTKRGVELLLKRGGFESVYVGYTPLDAVHAMIYGLGTPPSFVLRVAGLKARIPFTLIKPFLTRDFTFKLFQADETLGFGLMGLAGGPHHHPDNLKAAFLKARQEVMDRYMRYLDQDLLTKLWTNRKFILENLKYLPRMLRGG